MLIGLLGYLMPFAPLAFVSQCQCQSWCRPSKVELCDPTKIRSEDGGMGSLKLTCYINQNFEILLKKQNLVKATPGKYYNACLICNIE